MILLRQGPGGVSETSGPMLFELLNLCLQASQMVLVVKNLTANAGDLKDAGSIPGQEDPLEEDMTIHTTVLAWEIHGQKSLVGYSPWGCKELDTTEAT